MKKKYAIFGISILFCLALCMGGTLQYFGTTTNGNDVSDEIVPVVQQQDNDQRVHDGEKVRSSQRELMV